MNNYNFSFYEWSVDVLRTMSEDALRKNYVRLRKVAQKRLGNLGADELTRKSEYYKRWSHGFAAATELKGKTSLVYKLSDVMRFLSAKSSTVRGQKTIRRHKIATLQAHGFNVNDENFDDFISMVQDAKEEKTKYDVLTFKEDWNDKKIRAQKLLELLEK